MCAAETPAAQRDELRAIAEGYSRMHSSAAPAEAFDDSAIGNGGQDGDNRGQGMCYLVGAGPGGLDHLTLGAARLLQQAEVVVYDDLGTQAAMEAFAAPAAERLYVGKRGLQKSFKQSQIDALLVNLCSQGKRVVRLKGGCPSTFSRVSGEMAALAASGIPFRLVPGVSSALAAPLLAGFPLTDKARSASFAVLSGHDAGAVDWGTLRGVDTLVILMGGASLPGIVKGLRSAKGGGLPVAVIRDASSERQRMWVATVDTIVAVTMGETLSPSIIVAGDIVHMTQQPQQAEWGRRPEVDGSEAQPCPS